MKLKTILSTLIIGFGLINFSSAFSFTGDIPGEAFISYGGYSRSYLIDKNLNFRTDSQYKTFFYSFQPGNGVRNRALFWNDGKIAGYGNTTAGSIIAQGYYNTFCYTSISNLGYCNPGISISVPESYQTPIQEFYNLGAIYDSFYFDGGYASVIPYLCFLSSSRDIASCFYINITNNQGVVNPLDGTAILQGVFDNPGNFDQTKFQDSPFSSSSDSSTYYYSTGSCPSVGQLKAGFNLTPAVCYGGFGPNVLYGDQVSFVGGSGMNIFEIYQDYLDSFSDNSMDIQTWYDTYWSYYQNIARDSRPFEGLKKSYLGLQFARQTFGNTQGINGSYIILNYCYYVVNNISDNQSTCVGSNVSTQYSGITITDQDRKDLIDMVNDNYTIHTPGSGSIFHTLPVFSGGGSSSWGDEECSGIPCLFDRFYQMFTSSRVNDVDFSQGGQGILPGYIALAFVIVVLFYVFKR